MKLCIFICLFFVSVVLAKEVKYDEHKVYRIVPTNYEELQGVHSLSKREASLDFWQLSKGPHFPTDVVVPPSKIPNFENVLKELGIRFSIIIEDLQKKIEATKPKFNIFRPFDWTDYHKPCEINWWLRRMAWKHHRNAKLIVGGKSYEGRNIYGLKISFKKGNKLVFIEGGIHAREWIAPAVVTYLINEILTSEDPAVREMAESYDWIIFPSINPDGFEYTHTTDRLWRMNRQPHGECFGADLNRNWGYHWNEGGTEPNCNEKYPGTHPFSEIETQTLSKTISEVADDMVVYLAFHSYLQLFLIPYGYTNSPRAENYDELYEIGSKVVAAANERYGTNYTTGKWDELMYVSSGVSVEWVKGTFKTPITYTYELRDRGEHGFVLPPEQIIPTCLETMDAMKTFIREVKARGY